MYTHCVYTRPSSTNNRTALSSDLLRAMSRARSAADQRRTDALTGIIAARRESTVSMISPLSMPCR